MKVKDIKIENGELVVLTEARLPLSKCSREFVKDIIDNKHDIIYGKWYNNAFVESEFRILDNGQFSFDRSECKFAGEK